MDLAQLLFFFFCFFVFLSFSEKRLRCHILKGLTQFKRIVLRQNRFGKFTQQLQPIVHFHATLVLYNIPYTIQIGIVTNRMTSFCSTASKILCAYQSFKIVPCQKHYTASDSLKNHLIVLSLDNTALPASHVS